MNALQQAILSLSENIDVQSLKKASSFLTEQYRSGLSLSTEQELFAYLFVRLPATYAAIHAVLAQVVPGSILDIGAGPGTVWWAAKDAWEKTPVVTAIERETVFIELGKKLGSTAHWIHGNVLTFNHFDTHDWTVFGYSFGELPQQQELLNLAWQASKIGIVIVEPGTPRGYQNIQRARTYLVQQGGFVYAPCPHSNACPLQNDWCHFSVRLNRSFLHRQAKFATLPFEDEKFSYVIVTKEKPTTNASRIIRSPLHRSGHTILPLCTPDGLQEITVSRRQKELYKKIRKSSWGDAFHGESDCDW